MLTAMRGASGGLYHNANPEIMSLALKLANGAGNTTVMTMLIVWQVVKHLCRYC